MITRLVIAIAALCGAAFAGNPPVLNYLEMDTVPRWGRISVHGTDLDQAGQIHIGGIPAIVMPIQGTNAVEMNAYVPDTVPYGTWPVVVTTTEGQSNALQLTVVPKVPEGRALWRFAMNSQTMLHRPALGADGTVYAKSAAGDLIALTSEGDFKWLYQLGGSWTSQIDVGQDGTIYTADGWPRIHAVNPDGTQKWVHQAPLTNGLLGGPNVGPDGNVYAIAHAPGIGVYSLDPDGNLRWSSPEPGYSPIGQQGQEIVFGASQFHYAHNGHFDSYDFDGNKVFDQSVVTQYNDSSPQPAVGPNGDSYVEWWGRLHSYDTSGNLNWIAFDVGGSYLRDPDVGPDGTIYVWRNVFNTLWALNPDGSEKWSYNDPESLMEPVVSPDGETLVVTGGGWPGMYLGMDAATGVPLWQFVLPIETPTPFSTIGLFPQGRARFTPDSSVAYMMAIGESGSPGYSYVYALQIDPIVEIGHGLGGGNGVPRLQGDGILESNSPITLTVTDAQPNAPAFVVVGSAALGVPFREGVLVPEPDLVLSLSTDASGSLQLAGNWPANLPSNTPLYVQTWFQDATGPAGWCASNALSLITP
ncbi:MAG: PQQ-binding-like beta-propeller repeat protein [Planctomycetota bacterium]|jgi:hypothetical protein